MWECGLWSDMWTWNISWWKSIWCCSYSYLYLHERWNYREPLRQFKTFHGILDVKPEHWHKKSIIGVCYSSYVTEAYIKKLITYPHTVLLPIHLDTNIWNLQWKVSDYTFDQVFRNRCLHQCWSIKWSSELILLFHLLISGQFNWYFSWSTEHGAK